MSEPKTIVLENVSVVCDGGQAWARAGSTAGRHLR